MKRVFLAGACGVIGQRLVPLLRGAGYIVTGTTDMDGRITQCCTKEKRPATF